MKGCDGIILRKSLTKLFVSMVKELVKQFFIHLRSEGVVFLFENLLSNEYKRDPFVVVNKKLKKNNKKKSSKLLRCIQY